MSNPTAARAIIGLLFILGVAVGIFVAQQALGLRLSYPLRWGIVLALAVPGIWLTLAYWRRIDEAAREAQKTAWFWGGSVGMAGGFALVSLLSRPGLAGVLPEGAHPMQLGAVIVILVQLVGFLAAWAWWWWSKR